MRLFITGPSWRLSTALFSALAELPHPEVRISVVPWEKSPEGEPQAEDRWIIISASEQDVRRPQNVLGVDGEKLVEELPRILQHANLHGSYCQCQKAVAALRAGVSDAQ